MMNRLILMLFFLLAVNAIQAEQWIPAESESGNTIPGPIEAAGSPEFEIDRPRETGGRVLNAGDFGFHPEAQDNTSVLNRVLRQAKADKASKVILPPGTYRMTEPVSVTIAGFQDFTLDGQGALLVFSRRNGHAPSFQLNNNERVVIQNLDIDWNWDEDPLASLVEVVNVVPNAVDFRFYQYEYFPKREVRVACVTSLDPATESVGAENGFDRLFEFRGGDPKPRTEWLDGNTLRVFTNDSNRFAVGRKFRMQHYYYDMDGTRRDTGCFYAGGNTHLTFENINIFSCVGHAFLFGGAQQYWQLLKVRVAPPEGVDKRAISCTADHVHVVRSKGYLKIEDCDFGYGADDCVNVHVPGFFVRKTGQRSVMIGNVTNSLPEAEAEIEFRYGDYSPTGVSAKVIRVDRKEKQAEIFFDADVPDEKTAAGNGMVLFNRAYSSDNVIIRNNRFHHNRARALLLLANNITVENNRFEHLDMGAIYIETGYTDNFCSEGNGAGNIVVKNNYFEQSNKRGHTTNGKVRDILIHCYREKYNRYIPTSYPVISGVLVENNRFVDSFGFVGYISSAEKVIFRNNMIENRTPRETEMPYRGGFYVTHSRDAAFIGNLFPDSALSPKPGVYFDGNSVTKLIVHGNRIGAEQ